MQKNVSGQKVGVQMVSASDGSAFTGAVTVSVTGDAGTQATGSVGSGACAHEGNGYHTYAPAQAETNYDLIAFTFTGTGAVPQTVQIYTSAPQTGDAFARLGAPAGASISADIATKATPAQILTTALTEAYAADGAAGTLSQILFGIQAFLQERSVSGTTVTSKKLDGSTTAMTFTLDDATSPTSITRAT